MHSAACAGQMVHLQLFDLGCDIAWVVQQNRYSHQRAQVRRNAFCQIKAGQGFGGDGAGDDRVDDGRAKVRCYSKPNDAQQNQRKRAGPCGAHQRQGKGRDSQGHNTNRRQITLQADAPDPAHQRHTDRRAEGNLGLKRRAPFANQPMTRITGVNAVACISQSQAIRGHSTFGKVGSAGEDFDFGAIPVAGGKIHRGIGRVIAQCCIDKTDLLKEISPVHFGHQPHRGYDVAHRDIRRAKTRLRVCHHIINGCVLLLQPVFKPPEQRCAQGIEPAKAFRDLGRKNIRQGGRVKRCDHLLHDCQLRLARRLTRRQHRIYNGICLQPQ